MINESRLFSQILSNGLCISIYDRTKVYFGDYFHVKVEVVCLVPETAGNDISTTGNAVFKRFLEKMGVASGDVEAVKQQLVEDFIVNTMTYLSCEDFPLKLANQLPKNSQLKRQFTVSGF